MTQQEQNTGMNLKEVFKKLKDFKLLLISKLKFIVIISICCGLLVVARTSFLDSLYEAKLSFVIEESQSSSLAGFSGLASQFGMNLGGSGNGAFSQGNISELLLSRRVVEAALFDYGVLDDKNDLLINHHIKINNYHEKWSENEKFKSLVFSDNRQDFTISQDSILGLASMSLVENNIRIIKIDETSIISLVCQSKNEEFAKLLAESLIKKLEDFYVIFQAGKALNTLDFIENRADSILIALEESEVQYANYKDSNFGVTRARGLLEEIQLKRNVEILNVMYTEVIKNLEVSKFTLMNQTPLINIIDSPKFPLKSNAKSLIVSFVLGSVLGSILSSFYIIFLSIIREELS